MKHIQRLRLLLHLLTGMLVVLAGLAGPFGQARAFQGPTDPLEDIRFEQKLNEQIPLDLVFRDENGAEVHLGDYFDKKPVVLVFAYYNCPMLCGLVLGDLVTAFKEMKFTIGDEFEVVTISIDPREKPELAAQKKALHLESYGRAGAEKGWHFLTGEQASIDAITQATGFHYFYDESIDQFAHPTGVIILTPQGKISHYLFGLNFPPNDLRLSLVEASENKIGNPVDAFFLYCYHYDPKTGRYTLAITNILKLAGTLTVLIMGGGIFMMMRQERRSKNDGLPGGPITPTEGKNV